MNYTEEQLFEDIKNNKYKYRGYLLNPIVIHTSLKERKDNIITNTKDIDYLISATNDHSKDYFFNDSFATL